MCGILGAFALDGRPVDRALIERMRDIMAHRGPDDKGIHEAATKHAAAGPDVIFGHRRLSILDLTDAGHQPMHTAEGKVVITFNGEIYNHMELRAELEALGHTFVSTSDTETLLRGYIAWGEGLLPRLNGMFAFAILDLRTEPQLFLARDRFGQKPLYWTEHEGTFWFASEMKALLEIPGIPRTLSAAAVRAYLTYLWVPEPHTILQQVRKLSAGHLMLVTRENRTMRHYKPLPDRRKLDEKEAIGALREALKRAVIRTTLSDVPVGAFLSGGLDSSAIVQLMAEGGRPPDHVYTVGMDADDAAHEGFPDDVQYAKNIARAVGAPQTVTTLDSAMVRDLPHLVWHLDEPLADPAILPLYAMCQAAKGRTKVLLSGMGGDELFAGYRRHSVAAAMARWRRVPRLIRRTAVPIVGFFPSVGKGPLRPLFRRAKRFMRAAEHPSGSVAIGLASWSTREERHQVEGARLRGVTNGHDLADKEVIRPGEGSVLDELLRFDAQIYLPSHNLNYTDKISMAASVEVRAPLLDNELATIAAALPARLKVDRGRTKIALKEALRGILPEEILQRGKTGLGAPIRSWLVGPLKPLLDETLDAQRLDRSGLFDAAAVRHLRSLLESGREDTSHLVWAILILTLWMEAFNIPGDLA